MDPGPATPSLTGWIERVLELPGPLGCREHLETELGRLARGRATVVVVGAFKRGKSTLLNAILGRDLLPTGVVPVTALVTLLRPGPRERLLVQRPGSPPEEHPLHTLPSWITQEANPDNRLGVERVVVELPDLPGNGSVTLADTPGTGSIFTSNTEALRRWLGHIDAALFVVSSDPPIGEEDLALLEEVREVAGEVVVVLNKVDRLRPGELEESLAYTRRAVEGLLGGGTMVQPCSAREALERGPEGTGVDRLLEWISDLAAGRGREVLERAAARRVARSLARESALVVMERSAAKRSAGEIRSALDALARIAGELRLRLAEVTAAFDDGCRRLMARYDEASREQYPRLVATVEAALRRSAEELDARRPGRGRYRRELEAARDRAVLEALTPRQAAAEEDVMEGFRRLTRRALGRVNALVDEAYAEAAGLLGVSIDRFDVEEDFRMESRLEYRVGLPRVNLDAIAEGLILALPHAVGRRLFLRRHLRQLPDAVDRQLGLIRADLWERLRESAFSFTGELERRVELALDQLQESLERGAEAARSSGEATRRHVAALERRLAVLEEALRACRAIVPGSREPGPRE